MIIRNIIVIILLSTISMSHAEENSRHQSPHEGVKKIMSDVMQRYKDIKISQSISTEIEDSYWINSYTLKINRFLKARLWHKEYERDNNVRNNFDNFDLHVLGGGVSTPFFMVGNFYEYGAYKYFGDVSNTSASSTEHNQYTKWDIRSSPIQDAPQGARVSIPYTLWKKVKFDSYNPIMSVGVARYPQKSSNEVILPPTYMWDANVGYRFKFDVTDITVTWEPRLLYRHSSRERINFESSVWDNWIISTPTNYTLHQFVLSQKLSISKYVWVQMLNGISISENYKTSNFINGMLGIHISKLFITLHAGKFSPNVITDEWKFQKFLWVTSGKMIFHYMNASYITLQGKIAEYNQKNYIRPYPQSLYKMYSVAVVQQIEGMKKKVKFVPKAELYYSYSEYDEYYKNTLSLHVYHHGFVHSIKENTYWYIDEESRRMVKYKLNPSITEQYTFSFIPVTVFAKGVWLIEVSEDYPDDIEKEIRHEFFYDTTKSISTTVGFRVRHQGFYFSVQIMYEISEDSDEKEKKMFKSETLGKLKIQYNW